MRRALVMISMLLVGVPLASAGAPGAAEAALRAKQTRQLQALGYDSSVASRIAGRSEHLAQRLINGKTRPMTVYRGINTSLEAYDPESTNGPTLRVGNMWVTQVLHTANDFTNGAMLKLQIPESFGRMRVLEPDGKTIERMILDRKTEVPDDRVYLKEMFVAKEGRWLSYEGAVKEKIFAPLEE